MEPLGRLENIGLRFEHVGFRACGLELGVGPTVSRV